MCLQMSVTSLSLSLLDFVREKKILPKHKKRNSIFGGILRCTVPRPRRSLGKIIIRVLLNCQTTDYF